MKSYLVLICSALFVGAFCAVFAAPKENVNDGEPGSEPALYFPTYNINPPRVVNPIPDIEATSSSSDSSSSSSSESSSEEDDRVKPEGRTFFLILRLLQLLSQQNSTASG
ncbi:uncharacterized protein [Bactrocera oleae]|uniref:uncharacterized protein n=1 Tax=Bactrocera oleae TaxID=104688 RepID=UPI00387E2FD6